MRMIFGNEIRVGTVVIMATILGIAKIGDSKQCSHSLVIFMLTSSLCISP